MKKISRISIISLVIILFISCFVPIFANKITKVLADGEYTSEYYNLTDTQLDSLTNRTSVSSTDPQITVFTHGLGGSPAHWSNKLKIDNADVFYYEANSMIEQLRSSIEANSQNAVVYTVKTRELNRDLESLNKIDAQSQIIIEDNSTLGSTNLQCKYSVLNLTGNNRKLQYSLQEKNDYSIDYYDNFLLSNSDISKHIILIFKANNPDDSNDYVYAQFEYILDCISYQYRQLTGVLPTYNLIGHSRGGITNMQYALAHPYNVASLYSMGTPYNGSAFGSASELFLELGECADKVTYLPPDEGEDPDEDYYPGVLDILNSDLNNSYKSYWNNHYSIYNHIQFRPIGSYVTIGFVLQTLLDHLNSKNILSNECTQILRYIGLGAEIGLGVKSLISINALKARVIGMVIDGIKDIIVGLGVEISNPWVNIFANLRTMRVPYCHLGVSFNPLLCYADDLFIDLNSQIALGYTGTEVKVKLMDSIDQMEGGKSINAAGVGHNLETHDKDIIKYVVSGLNTGLTPQYELRYENNGCVITGVNYCDGNILDIPSTINGVNVIGIDRLTRDVIIDLESTVAYHADITTVKIPQTVQKIGDYAFYGMSSLQTVLFMGTPQLTEIGEGAFCKCSSLQSIYLPSGISTIPSGAFLGCRSLIFTIPSYVTSIGDYAFSNCNGLTSVNIHQNLNEIGEGAFNNCINITAYNVDVSNTAFTGIDGVLYSKDKRELISYPLGKTNLTYTVDSDCEEIADYAFAHNCYLQTLNLVNVSTIRQYGLYDCNSLSVINTYNLNLIGIDALSGTMWLLNQTGDSVILGNVYVKYRGHSASVSLSGVASIAPLAFEGNQDIESIYIYDENVINIGDYALSNCNNLESVYICKKSHILYISAGTFYDNAEDRTIYVPNTLLNDYLDNILWQQYEDDIDVHETIIIFNTNGGSNCANGVVQYQNYLSLPLPTKTGYHFMGWYDNQNYTGQPLNEQTLWDNLDDTVTFYAKWEITTYTVTFIAKGGNVYPTSLDYTILSSINFPTPSKTGYAFDGWYENEDYLGEPISQISAGSYGDKIVYAKWNSNEYMVTLNLNYTGAQSLQENIHYGTRDYITVPIRNGYHFIGWMLNNEIITDSNGQLYEPWAHTETVTLYAVWESNTYNFILDFSHLDGFNETIVSVSSNDIQYIVFTASRNGNICLWTSHTTGDPYLYLYDSNLNVLAYNDDGYGNGDSKITYSVNSNTEYRIGFKASGSTSTTGKVYVGYKFEAVFDSAMPPIGLSVPSKDYYTFNGYYLGVNGSGVKYYNSDMSSARVWNIANNTTTLYAHFVPIQYNITWVIPSTTYDGKTIDNALYTLTNATLNYNCESSLSMATISSVAYNLIGWFSTSTFDIGTEVLSIQPGTFGDKVFYAKIVMQEYTITFNANGGSSCNSITQKYGEYITLPVSTKTNYKGSWNSWTMDGNLPVSNFGQQYQVFSNQTLTASWKRYYNINYQNLYFGTAQAEVLWDNWLYVDAPNYYFSGYMFELNRASGYFQSSSPYSPQLRFLGWYNSSDFNTQVTSISASSTGTVTVYAKWRYDYDNPSRIGTYTINNADPLNQTYYDQKYIGLGYNNLYQNLINIGITKLTFSFKLRSWGEGTQHIFVYNESGTQLASTTFSSTSSATIHTYQFTINLSSLGSSNYIYIRYQADTYWSWFQYKSRYWYCDYLYMEMSYVVNESDFYNPEFYWHYQDPFD